MSNLDLVISLIGVGAVSFLVFVWEFVDKELCGPYENTK